MSFPRTNRHVIDVICTEQNNKTTLDFDSVLLGESPVPVHPTPHLGLRSMYTLSLFIQLHKTSSFNAVIITMDTRGHPITICIMGHNQPLSQLYGA